jgi:predicted transcriptional regulator
MTASAHPNPIPEGLQPVYAVPRGVEAHHVMRFMSARGTRAVVVLGGLRPVGMVTARDLADRIPGGGLSATFAKAESAMSSPLITIGEWGTVVDAIALMNQHGVSHLPIVSANGALVSLITLSDAQRLHGEGVPALGEFVRTSVIVPMVRRNPWKRMMFAIQRWIRENRLWWFLAMGLALAGAVLALAIGRSWLGFQTYQPREYEPKDIPRQQYEEEKLKHGEMQKKPDTGVR